MKPANLVVEFADWFSNRHRQVSYKHFLRMNYRTENSRPSRSHHRLDGCFIGMLSVRYLCKKNKLKRSCWETDFGSFWDCLRSKEDDYGPCVTQDFSFSNPLIQATFDFARNILDILGMINTVFQERYSTVQELLDIIVSLKLEIDRLIGQRVRSFQLELTA